MAPRTLLSAFAALGAAHAYGGRVRRSPRGPKPTPSPRRRDPVVEPLESWGAFDVGRHRVGVSTVSWGDPACGWTKGLKRKKSTNDELRARRVEISWSRRRHGNFVEVGLRRRRGWRFRGGGSWRRRGYDVKIFAEAGRAAPPRRLLKEPPSTGGSADTRRGRNDDAAGSRPGDGSRDV